MKLSSSSIKKVPDISSKLKNNIFSDPFLYFHKQNPTIFSQSPKNKRSPSWENLLRFRKQKPLYFEKRKPRKNSSYFRKRNSYSKPYKHLVYKQRSAVIAIIKISLRSIQNLFNIDK